MVVGIETSCDETAVAVLDGEGHILSNVLNSQIDVHARYGGVVPELASRCHMECIELLTSEALDHAKISLSQLTGGRLTCRSKFCQSPRLCHQYSLCIGEPFRGPFGVSLAGQSPSVNSCHGFDRVRWSYAFGFSSESGRIPIYRMDNG